MKDKKHNISWYFRGNKTCWALAAISDSLEEAEEILGAFERKTDKLLVKQSWGRFSPSISQKPISWILEEERKFLYDHMKADLGEDFLEDKDWILYKLYNKIGEEWFPDFEPHPELNGKKNILVIGLKKKNG